MKKVLVLLLVFGMASAANAGLWISVNGDVDPPDTEVWLAPSEWAVIDVYSDGTTASDQEFRLFVTNGGYDISGAINTVNEGGVYDLGFGEIFLDLAVVAVPIPPVPQGTVIDQILVHCEAPDIDMFLELVASRDGLLDSQIIHQLPEPATIALLGLGGLALLRRRK